MTWQQETIEQTQHPNEGNTMMMRGVLGALLALGGWSCLLRAEEMPRAIKPQETILLPVEVTDAQGKPVEGAKVIPWALRSSQGHGMWRAGGATENGPPTLVTDHAGVVEVPYPRFAKPAEEVLTLEVTLSIDHLEFAFIHYEFIDVPRAAEEPHRVTLSKGAALELTPTSEGEPVPLDEIYAMWSDGRSWSEKEPVTRTGQAIRIPPLPAGKGYVRLIWLEGSRAKAFSRLVELDLIAGETIRRSEEMLPAVAIRGHLSENVPRPVTNGRVKAETLGRPGVEGEIEWFTWAPVAEDGSFEIPAWPQGESIQAVALCDGYIGAQGIALKGLKEQRAGSGFYRRPQIFPLGDDIEANHLVIEMEPLATCEVATMDEQGQPIAGVEVLAYPNVHWWNNGSQIYCAPLTRMERVLLTRDYELTIETAYPTPFSATSDEHGIARMELPKGTGDLWADHDSFELPIALGRRQLEVDVAAGDNQFAMKLQPKGTELLGEWDKLAGVLFGCRGEECRRLISDPAFRAKMDSVRAEFDLAADPTAPSLLHGAYKKMAAAFDELDDQQEAAKWRRKAEEQAAKLKDR